MGDAHPQAIAGQENAEQYQANPEMNKGFKSRSWTLANPAKALSISDTKFDQIAKRTDFYSYWSRIAPSQNKVVVAHIESAFSALGLDSKGSKHANAALSQVFLPKYRPLIQRLTDILQDY